LTLAQPMLCYAQNLLPARYAERPRAGLFVSGVGHAI